MATLDEFCKAHARGFASAERLHAVGCHSPSDLHRFTTKELSTLLGIDDDAAERLIGACSVAIDLEPEIDHAASMGVLLRPDPEAELELDLCLRLAQAGVSSVEELARSSPLELGRALDLDAGRVMRLVAWAEHWLEEHDRRSELRTEVLRPAPRRAERFSPAETAFAPRSDVLDFELLRSRRSNPADQP